ncbi:hypothetical protein ANANG_G00103640 [Anguilla anguilla]|uniref:Uncharacterized protein n=1 Tax=Anguilla anguilla TaxID=7936 RepID=A0A9D3RZC0_ANGAN|nr:hypothetical protein ANANG_G00103640 [Anguilla anguilla]
MACGSASEDDAVQAAAVTQPAEENADLPVRPRPSGLVPRRFAGGRGQERDGLGVSLTRTAFPDERLRRGPRRIVGRRRENRRRGFGSRRHLCPEAVLCLRLSPSSVLMVPAHL